MDLTSTPKCWEVPHTVWCANTTPRHELYTQLEFYTVDASEIEDSAPAHDTSCAGSLTTKDDAACRTSDSAVASWLNDAASHFPQPGATLTQLLETPTPEPAEKSVVNARRKRALNTTSSGDDKPALEPSKRRKQSVLCALCERD